MSQLRFYDEFTDSNGKLHDAATATILLGDYNVQPGEAVDRSRYRRN